MKIAILTLTVTSILLQPSNCYAIEKKYHALLIGINKYSNEIDDLDGAVNDIYLLQKSIKENLETGIIKTVANQNASKENIKKLWMGIIKAAQPNDTIIFSFSGHGLHEHDKNGDEKSRNPTDNHDETLLLSNFSTLSENRANERIVDDELAEWFDLAIKKDIKILYLADTCFSGDSFRNNRRNKLRSPYKTTKALEKTQDFLEKLPILSDSSEEKLSNNFHSISATNSNQHAEEITVNGKAYGALSWFFSLALKEANTNNDKHLSQSELFSYIEKNIILTTRKAMTPKSFPEPKTKPLLTLKRINHKKPSLSLDTILYLQENSPIISEIKTLHDINHLTDNNIITHHLSKKTIYKNIYYILIKSSLKEEEIKCLSPSKSLYKQGFTKIKITPPHGKTTLITIAVPDSAIEINKSLRNSIKENKACTFNHINHKIPGLIKKTPYQLGIVEYFTWK